MFTKLFGLNKTQSWSDLPENVRDEILAAQEATSHYGIR